MFQNITRIKMDDPFFKIDINEEQILKTHILPIDEWEP